MKRIIVLIVSFLGMVISFTVFESLVLTGIFAFVFYIDLHVLGLCTESEGEKFSPNLTDASTEAIKHNTNYWTGERIAAEKNAAEYARVSAEYQKAIYDKLNKEGK